MPNFSKNWTYKDIKNFLENSHFILINTRGSHHYFSGNIDGEPRMVTVPFHNQKSILPRTFNSIVRQSGIKKEKWFEYGE